VIGGIERIEHIEQIERVKRSPRQMTPETQGLEACNT
jgi:hypothetical protein